ncbi:zinc-dependent peptidase [Lacinutrix jangbogonensis]|uniref:zinc-dependent peptidase n=1 Tax=Lacinutrix jangbogonensis TaxID=1469557 RepID=UPI00053DFB40|nr:zinc-dependent peptidase [Lacinutrix jangbogonensis]
MLKIVSLLQKQESPLVFKIVVILLGVITAFLVVFIISRGVFLFFEMAFVEFFKKKQFFIHFYFRKKKLSQNYRLILKQEFSFYNKLNPIERKNFEHRIQYFINNWEFIGKEIEVTNAMKVKIAATATKITFGFRDYKIQCIDKVVIYPRTYFSTINQQWHKGEFNMGYNALIFSWEDFIKGYAIEDDNLNLGVHECIHALHFSFLKSRRYNTSAAIFLDTFLELTRDLDADDALKQKLISSGYFRAYAFENQFEFISVLVENFIETPSEFRSQFPNIYGKVKMMLNFNFAGY